MHALTHVDTTACAHMCTQAGEQAFSMDQLMSAAEATHYANMAVADVEAAFLEGACPRVHCAGVRVW